MNNPNSKESAQLIAMLHVPSSSVLCRNNYAGYLGLSNYKKHELSALDEIRKQLNLLSSRVCQESGIDLFRYCRNASFVLYKSEVEELENKISVFPFVRQLINRATKEAGIYYQHGIRIFEIENIGAPYFIGNEIPIEELLILLVIAKHIQTAFPDVKLGMQVLSCGELEALPIALACNAFFVRSEASLFKALRPEGETNNKGNTAKFYYLRNYLLQKTKESSDSDSAIYPQLWCDFQKKHSIFDGKLNQLDTWGVNILFQKIEGVILTGNETGRDVQEDDFIKMRKHLDFVHEKLTQIYDGPGRVKIPLISGSGANIEMYHRYVDYMIIGTAFKKNAYWENEVDEPAVADLTARLKMIHH